MELSRTIPSVALDWSVFNMVWCCHLSNYAVIAVNKSWDDKALQHFFWGGGGEGNLLHDTIFQTQSCLWAAWSSPTHKKDSCWVKIAAMHHLRPLHTNCESARTIQIATESFTARRRAVLAKSGRLLNGKSFRCRASSKIGSPYCPRCNAG